MGRNRLSIGVVAKHRRSTPTVNPAATQILFVLTPGGNEGVPAGPPDTTPRANIKSVSSAFLSHRAMLAGQPPAGKPHPAPESQDLITQPTVRRGCPQT